MDVLARGQVHQGVAPPLGRPAHLLHLLLDGGSDGRVTDVGIDLDQKIPPDDHRLELRVVDVGRYNGPPPGNLVTDKLGRNLGRDGRPERFARMLM